MRIAVIRLITPAPPGYVVWLKRQWAMTGTAEAVAQVLVGRRSYPDAARAARNRSRSKLRSSDRDDFASTRPGVEVQCSRQVCLNVRPGRRMEWGILKHPGRRHRPEGYRAEAHGQNSWYYSRNAAENSAFNSSSGDPRPGLVLGFQPSTPSGLFLPMHLRRSFAGLEKVGSDL